MLSRPITIVLISIKRVNLFVYRGLIARKSQVLLITKVVKPLPQRSIKIHLTRGHIFSL